MTALLYLEWHAFRNGLAAIVRSPLRLIFWLLIAGYFISILAVPRRYGVGGVDGHGALFAPPVATAIGGALVAIVGLLIITSRSARFFRTPAEARLIASSGVSWRTIVLWLDVRALRTVFARSLPLIAFYVTVLTRHQTTLLAQGLGFGALTIVAISIEAMRLPLFVIFRRTPRWASAIIGGAFAVAGLIVLAFGALSMVGDSAPFAHFRGSPFDPARFVNRLVAGDWRALATVLVVPLAGLAVVWTDAGSSVPELYELAMKGALAKGRGTRGAQATHSRKARLPAGVGTIFWLDWTTFLRTAFARDITIFGAIASVALGVGLSIALKHGFDPDVAWSIVGTLAASLFAQPTIATIELANHLAKPFWWFSVAPLRARLAAWTFARSWRIALISAGAPTILGCSVAGPVALWIVPAMFAAFWFLNSIGVAVYALLPSAMDQRSPIYILRMFVGVVFIVPAIALYVVLIAFDKVLLANLLTAAFILVETVLLIEFATYRIGRNAAGIALLERSQ